MRYIHPSLARRRIGHSSKMRPFSQSHKQNADFESANPVVVETKVTKSKPVKKITSNIVDAATQDAVMTLPFIEGSFRAISCSREKATAIQRWIYKVNKDNAAGRVIATRYNYHTGTLVYWRMA